MLLVLKNVKERNKQYVKSFLFFTEVTNVKYSYRMVFIKYGKNLLKKPIEEFIFFSEVTD